MSADNQQERLEKLNPWYITGFVEGEGTFHIAMYKDPRMKFGVKVIPEFHVSQSYLRITTLHEIQRHFNCGYIRENHRLRKNDVTHVYVVRDRNDLLKRIIPFFRRYPLLSNKHQSFEIFAKIVEALKDNEHATLEGIKKIIRAAYEMNDKGKYRKISITQLLSSLKSSETTRRNPVKAG